MFKERIISSTGLVAIRQIKCVQDFHDSPIICGYRVEAHNKFKYGIVWKTCQKVLVGVHLLRWIVTYPVDKVIRSLNNWGQGDTGRRRGRVIRGAVMSNIDKLIRFEKKKKKQPRDPYGKTIVGLYADVKLHLIKGT